jgi:hypothetical protein
MELPKIRHATLYPDGGVYLKIGLYRNASIEPVGAVYHDWFHNGDPTRGRVGFGW